MAYMNQEKKAKIKENLNKVLKGTNIKFSLRVRNHTTIECTIKSAPIDFIENFNETCSKNPRYVKDGFTKQTGSIDVNTYWYKEHFSGKPLEVIDKIVKALYSADYYDNSDIMTDYFDTAYYVNLSIGRWDKPFQVK